MDHKNYIRIKKPFNCIVEVCEEITKERETPKPKQSKLKIEVSDILNNMIDLMGEGGMDTSYSGNNYQKAIDKAIKEIVLLIKKP